MLTSYKRLQADDSYFNTLIRLHGDGDKSSTCLLPKVPQFVCFWKIASIVHLFVKKVQMYELDLVENDARLWDIIFAYAIR